MKTIIFSSNKEYYYVKELAKCGFCNWVGTKKFGELPEQHPMKLDYAVQYDGSYFRKILPFNFWKVKHGEESQVDDNHELVRDYITCGRHKKVRDHAKFTGKLSRDAEKIEGLFIRGHVITSKKGIKNKIKYYVLGYALIVDEGYLVDESKKN